MEILKVVNLAVIFLLEVCLLVIFGLWGFTTGDSLGLKVLLGIGTPALVAVFWGMFMAPKARRRFPSPWHQVAQVVIFGIATFALAGAGQQTLAIIFAVVFAITFILRLVWKQSAASMVKQ